MKSLLDLKTKAFEPFLASVSLDIALSLVKESLFEAVRAHKVEEFRSMVSLH